MNFQQAFKELVKDSYVKENEIESYELKRKEVIKDFNVFSFRVKEAILRSHGCLNLVNSSPYDLIKKQIWKIDDYFGNHSPAAQGCIIRCMINEISVQ